jgi:N utilization substance protein B
VHAVAHDRDILDQKIIPLIENWRFDRLGIPTILILRLAVWEIMHTDTDPVVIINEAVELAKCFGEKDSFKFINGVLDQFVKQAE